MNKFSIKAMKALKIKEKRLYKIEPNTFFENEVKVAKALSEALIDNDEEAFQEIIIGYWRFKESSYE